MNVTLIATEGKSYKKLSNLYGLPCPEFTVRFGPPYPYSEE